MMSRVGLLLAALSIRFTLTLARTLSSRFRRASPGKDAVHDLKIPLVARVLVDRRLTPFQVNHGCPWLCPCRRIGERDFVVDRVGGCTRETFDHVQVFAGSHDIAFWRGV